ncbi:hypothetical protein MFRU_007g00830 [Monilinia fructicola]|nr:hypothetical protein MFRU_007g00830 [Monilinia fructicola]
MDALFTNITLPIYANLIPYMQTAYPHLKDTLPLIHQTYQTLHAILHPLYTQALTLLTPILLPLLDLAAREAQRSPGLFALGVLLLILWGVFCIVGFVRRVVAFGVRLAFGVVFWGAVGLGAWIVWERGVGRSGAELWVWVMGVRERFGEEYERAVREREMGRW